jgi:dipeptidyl aminopeptidase/acylaminoacyl peptidase
MRKFAVTAAIVGLTAVTWVSKAEAEAAVPLKEFFAVDVMSQPKLSPDGKRLAVLVANAQTGRRQLGVIDLDAGLKPTVAAAFSDADIAQVQWVNDRRLSFTATDLDSVFDQQRPPGLYAVNHDGSDQRHLVQRRWRASITNEAASVRELTPNHRLLRTLRDGSADVIITRDNFDDNTRDFVDSTPLRLDTMTGRSVPLLSTYPRGTRNWLVDASGNPRMAFAQRDSQAHVHWKAKPDAPWKQVASFDAYRGGVGFAPVELGPDDEVYGSAYRGSTGGITELFRFDRLNERLDPTPVVSVQGFDYQGHLDFDHRQRKLLGVRLTADALSTVWLDDGMKQLQARIDQRLQGLVNLLDVPECNCGRWAVVTSYSDRQPPLYLLYDRENDKLQLLGRARPGIDAKRMAQRDFARFSARDGRSIPVHVTRPAGKGPWPAVVLVHGGPQVRGGSWEWTSEAQFLASRGYLVVEPEFRGSKGYGSDHFRAGWKQWGLKMQDDIADATRWAIDQKLADPARICIAGASYGGYASLMGLIRDASLYRCGAAWVAVTDISLLYDIHWSDLPEDWRNFGMPVLIGDRVKDAAQFDATSPLKRAAELKQPLLLAFGSADRRVPIEHGTRFRDAVKKTNDQVEWVEYANEGHAWTRPDTRFDFYGRLEKFLATHLQSK